MPWKLLHEGRSEREFQHHAGNVIVRPVADCVRGTHRVKEIHARPTRQSQGKAFRHEAIFLPAASIMFQQEFIGWHKSPSAGRLPRRSEPAGRGVGFSGSASPLPHSSASRIGFAGPVSNTRSVESWGSARFLGIIGSRTPRKRSFLSGGTKSPHRVLTTAAPCI